MSEQTSKHGPGRDEHLKHETQELVSGPAEGLAEELAEGLETGPDTLPDIRRGAPPGMSSSDVETRTDIARALGPSAFPGDREDLVVVASANQAPDGVIGRLRSLPPGETFQNVQDVALALGLHVERRRG